MWLEGLLLDTLEINNTLNLDKVHPDFRNHPFAPVILRYIEILKAHNDYQEAEKLTNIISSPLTDEGIRVIVDTVLAIEKLIGKDDRSFEEEVNFASFVFN